MKLTYEKCEAIYELTSEWKKENPYTPLMSGLGVVLLTIGNETAVCINEDKICDIEEIGQIIKELGFIKDALECECGIVL